MLDTLHDSCYDIATASETPQNRKEVKPHETF
nr:MAG TPA: hypothetical protein [Caudoviricetes sp.]